MKIILRVEKKGRVKEKEHKEIIQSWCIVIQSPKIYKTVTNSK